MRADFAYRSNLGSQQDFPGTRKGTPSSLRAQGFLIPGIFILSGAAGLVFEVVWARQLVLVFGNTTQAVSAILTGFFGGMAIGSWYGGKLADRSSRPLRLYGLLELCLVGVVLLTPVSFRLIHEVYRSAFGALESAPKALALVRFVLALAALAPATILMGATLPTLTRHLARKASDLSAAFARLYLANTLGAIFGAAATGLVLIELIGLSKALLVGAAFSGMAGLIALGLDRRQGQVPPAGYHSRVAENGAVSSSTLNVALAVAFVSGLSALSYQVLWTRLIASGTGSSTYVFTNILTTFLIGLAWGAIEFKRLRHRLGNSILVLAACQVAISVLAVSGLYAMNFISPIADNFHLKTFLVVLPATFFMGLSFPASSSLLGGSDSQVGARAGQLLAVNTAGAIVGTFVVPFALIPLVGAPAALGIVALVNAITGVTLALRISTPWRKLRRVAIAGGVLATTSVVAAFLVGSLFIDPQVARMRRSGSVLYRTTEDEIASVQSGMMSGQKHLWVAGHSMTALTVDAKLMPLLPLILRPTSSTMLVVAFGMGSSYRTALIAGLRTDVVDLVPSVPLMFDTFYSDAGEMLRNPRGRVIIADGRSHVELTDRRYDLIVVDPPPPIESAGVSVISSLEFYRASRSRLTPGGVMMQWVPWGQTLDDFRNHVRTFRTVFPHVIVALGPGGNGAYMLGSEQPVAFGTERLRAILSRPGVVQDISASFDTPETSLEGWVARIPTLVRLQGDDVTRFAGAGKLITDDRPLPEYFLIRQAFADDLHGVAPEDIR